MKNHLSKIGAALLVSVSTVTSLSSASSHREAPFISKNPKVDASDFYMFRSYEAARDGFVTVVANYQPFQSRYGGPNFFPLDPDALYEIHIDNNGDAIEDLTFQFRFQTALVGKTVPVGGQNVAVPFYNLASVTAADENGLNIIETYSMQLVTGDRRTGTSAAVTAAGGGVSFRKPADNVGSKSFADYATYAKTFVQTITIPGCATPGKVFVGQRAESFAVNLGVVFDLVNAPLSTIGDAALRGTTQSVIKDNNVTSIALELPVSCIKAANKDVIGGWTSASVRQARVIDPSPTFNGPSVEGGAWAQVSRLGMPLVNELVIGLPQKDLFNSSEPKDDAQFATYVTNPTLPEIIETLYGAANAPAPNAFPRTDLVSVFLKGVTGVNENGSTAEMQRLNVALPVTAAATQNNLGAAACFPNRSLVAVTDAGGCDVAGFPNGRRPGDDVVDVSLRVLMGYLLPAPDAAAGAVPLHDAVLQDQVQFDTVFPYLKAPTGGT